MPNPCEKRGINDDTEDLCATLLELASALDPYHKGKCWPDSTNGRAPMDQLQDLVTAALIEARHIWVSLNGITEGNRRMFAALERAEALLR